MECGDGLGSVLAADRLRGRHRRRHDSDGGRGIGKEVWGGVSGLPEGGSKYSSETEFMTTTVGTSERRPTIVWGKFIQAPELYRSA